MTEPTKQGWTMKQIADELGVNKMRVYRTISRLNLKEAYKRGQTLYFDKAARKAVETAIQGGKTQVNTSQPKANQSQPTAHSTNSNPPANNELIKALSNRIEMQQNQIESLTRLLDQSQRLQLISEQRTQKIEKQVTDLQKQLSYAGNASAVATMPRPQTASENSDSNRQKMDPDYFDQAEKDAHQPQTEAGKPTIIQKPEKQDGGFFKHFWQKPLL